MNLRRIVDEALPLDLLIPLRDQGCQIDAFPTVWRGLNDGAMLDRFDAEGGGILVTCVRNIRFQQSLDRRNVGFVILPGQRLLQLRPIMGRIADAIRIAVVRDVVIVDRSGRISRPTV